MTDADAPAPEVCMCGKQTSVQMKAPVRLTSMNFLKASSRCATVSAVSGKKALQGPASGQ